jgi:DNA repair exonuclease SbcCD ATPase subunit
MTDEDMQVKQLRSRALWLTEFDDLEAKEVEEAADRIEALKAESFKLAAGSCDVEGGKVGDEHGHFYCTLQAKVEAQAAEIERLTEAYNNLGNKALEQVSKLGTESGRKDVQIDALSADLNQTNRENEELREYLSSALETLRDAGVCDDKCSLCNEAFAALDTGITIEATQEGGWKEAGQPWPWTYDPHLKEKKP